MISLLRERFLSLFERERFEPAGYHIKTIGGNCPLQADGDMLGENFYFRSRGEHWTLGVGLEPVSNPDWEMIVRYSDKQFEAGWITNEEARQMIKMAAKAYKAFRDE